MTKVSHQSRHSGNGKADDADLEFPPTSDDAGLDPFDPARLRLTQNFAETVGVKKMMLTVPVRKPDKTWFIQTHPDPSYRLQTAVIELKEDRETYLVDPSLWADLSTETVFGPRLIVTTINRQGVIFLWPIRLPGADGKLDEWSRSSAEAAELARASWVRVQANMPLGAYDVFQAAGDIPDPKWPETPFHELLRTGFKEKLIDSLDHPVLRKLRGEA